MPSFALRHTHVGWSELNDDCLPLQPIAWTRQGPPRDVEQAACATMICRWRHPVATLLPPCCHPVCCHPVATLLPIAPAHAVHVPLSKRRLPLAVPGMKGIMHFRHAHIFVRPGVCFRMATSHACRRQTPRSPARPRQRAGRLPIVPARRAVVTASPPGAARAELGPELVHTLADSARPIASTIRTARPSSCSFGAVAAWLAGVPDAVDRPMMAPDHVDRLCVCPLSDGTVTEPWRLR